MLMLYSSLGVSATFQQIHYNAHAITPYNKSQTLAIFKHAHLLYAGQHLFEEQTTINYRSDSVK